MRLSKDSMLKFLESGGEMGTVDLIGNNTDKMSMYAINYFLAGLCNNYIKIETIKRICLLKQLGVSDAQFLLAQKSADIFPVKSEPEKESELLFEESRSRADTEKLRQELLTYFSSDEEYATTQISAFIAPRDDSDTKASEPEPQKKPANGDYIVLGNEESEHLLFWNGILRRARPIVMLDTYDGPEPIFDIYGDEAIKVTSLRYHSPPIMSVNGIFSSLVDLAYAGNQDQREEEAHIMNLIGNSAENIERMARASQTVNDEKTPPGVRAYANDALNQLMQKQAKMNLRMDIRIQKMDRKV